jgi:CHAT domain-containing protein
VRAVLFTPLALVVVACAERAQDIPLDRLRADAQAQLQSGDLKRAEATTEEGLRRAHEKGDARAARSLVLLKAEVLIAKRRHRDGLGLLDEILAGADPSEETARAQMTRGFARCFTAQSIADNARADRDFDDAERAATQLGNSKLTADVELRRGSCALSRREFSAAERHFRRTLELARGLGLPLLEINGTVSIGLLELNAGHFDQAADLLSRSLSRARGLKASGLVLKALANLGLCEYYLGEYDTAITHLSEAISLAESLDYRGDLRSSLTTLGGAYYQKGDYRSAASRYRRALGVARGLGDQRRVGWLFVNLAATSLDEGHVEDAAALNEKALGILRNAGDRTAEQHCLVDRSRILLARGRVQEATDALRLVLSSEIDDESTRWSAHSQLADLHLATGRTADAAAEFGRAFGIMENSRARLNAAEHRISFFSSLARFYDRYIRLLISQGKVEHALDVADRTRARQLRERLDQNPRTKAAARNQFGVTAKELDAVLLFYSLAVERSYLWVVTPRQIALHRLPAEKEIAEHIERYRSLILRSGDPLAEESTDGKWLYDTLVGPVARAIAPGTRVVVVPDGALHQINFETLVVPSPAPHFWIEDVTLATAPSLGLLEATAKRKAGPEQQAQPILLVGDPVASGKEFPALPYAGSEMERIAEQFDSVQTTRYGGAQAVPDVYKRSEPGRFSYIHFAAHAKPSSESPLDSAIVLSPRGDAFKLYAREIVNIPVRADLVTLSACYGAGARNYSGEGFVGLAWAFMSSGAKNVIAALWNVEDASTAELMEDLYRGLKSGEPPPEALRAAKLNLIHSQTAHRKPYYWAPFITYTRHWGARKPDSTHVALR